MKYAEKMEAENETDSLREMMEETKDVENVDRLNGGTVGVIG